jgi:hypothetical protein
MNTKVIGYEIIALFEDEVILKTGFIISLVDALAVETHYRHYYSDNNVKVLITTLYSGLNKVSPL